LQFSARVNFIVLLLSLLVLWYNVSANHRILFVSLVVVLTRVSR